MHSLVAIKYLTNIGLGFLREILDLSKVTYILVSKHRDIIGKCIYDDLARAGMPQHESDAMLVECTALLQSSP